MKGGFKSKTSGNPPPKRWLNVKDLKVLQVVTFVGQFGGAIFPKQLFVWQEI